MSDDAVGNATARIDRALARIEAAARSRETALDRLHRRHSLLRDRVSAAIAALDDEIAEARADG